MSSRVVSVRFDDVTIAQCFLLLNKHKVVISNMPMSTAIRTVLETIIMQQVRSKVLEPLDKETAKVFLLNQLNEDEAPIAEVDFGAALRQVASSIDKDGTYTKADSDNAIGEQIAKEINASRQPQISKNLEIQDEDDPDIEDSAPVLEGSPFWNYPYMALADITEVAPEDTIITKFLEERGKGKGNPTQLKIMQRCIEIAYKQRPPEEWGTDNMRKMVTNLYQDHM